jgi:predicted PurR-regulated permease PerM
MTIKKIEISTKTIIFTVLFLISLFVLWQVKSLIVLLFVSIVFMQALNPTVARLEKFKIPRPLGILVSYIVILSFISFAVAGIVPALIEQTTSLINSIPDIIQNTKILGANAADFSSQFKILENVPTNIAKMAISIVSNIFAMSVIFFITFYLLMEKKNLSKYGQSFLGQKGNEKFLRIIDLLEVKIGSWVNAQLILMVVIGILSYLGFLFLGLKYAIPLAIFAGLLEAVPTIGPTISTIVAGLIGFTISPITGLLVILWGIIVQQLENNFLVPKIMSKTVGFNPLITIILIAAGAKIGGILGAVLAIPVVLTAEIIYKVINEKEIK